MKNKDIKYGPLSQEQSNGSDNITISVRETAITCKQKITKMTGALLLAIITVIFIAALCLTDHHIEGDNIQVDNKIQQDGDSPEKARAYIYSVEEYLNGRSPISEEIPRPILTHSIISDGSPPRRIVCYYNYPNVDDPSSLLPENINCTLCSHIIVAFANIKNNTVFMDPAMETTIEKLYLLKKCNPELKVLFSIGGSKQNEGFSAMVLNHANRKEFIGSVKNVLRRLKLDGIDLDWEFPGVHDLNHLVADVKSKERMHFSQLLRELRVEFQREKRDYLLTVAVAAPETIVRISYDVDQINMYADFINLMSYDFHFYTKYTPFTGFNAPLYGRPDDMFLGMLNINYTAYYWMTHGMDPSKIVIGLPTYGHSFSLINANNGNPGSPAFDFGNLGDSGFVNYSIICEFIQKHTNVELCYDNDSVSPYLHDGHEWVSYDNERSLQEKAQYILDSPFGGAMIYSLNSDDYLGKCEGSSPEKFPLIRQIADILSKNTTNL